MIPPLPRNAVLVIVVVVALALWLLIARQCQRCPHCGAFVRRARRGWIRCRKCGRQYHRSVKLR